MAAVFMDHLKHRKACQFQSAGLYKGAPRLPKIRGAVLLIQLGDIGDVVLSLPAVSALRRRFPQCGIWMGIRERARGLLEDIPEVDGRLSVDAPPASMPAALRYHAGWIRILRRQRFALAVDLRTGSRGTLLAGLSGAPVRIGRLDHGKQGVRKSVFTHLVQPDPHMERHQYAVAHHLNILAAVGISAAPEAPEIPVPQEKRAQIQALFEAQGVPPDRPVAAISPFSLWSYKEWRPDGWIRVMRHLVERRGLSVVVTGATGENPRAQALLKAMPEGHFNLAGKTPMGILPALFSMCRLFIGVDSGSLHVAAAVGTPTVALFGPSSAATWAPRGKGHLTVSKTWSCVPCREKGCNGSGISRCLEEMTVDEVLAAVDEQFGKAANGKW